METGTKMRSRFVVAFEYAHAQNWGISNGKLERLGGASRLLRMSPEARALMLGLTTKPLSGLPRTEA